MPGDPLAGFLLAWDQNRPPLFLGLAVAASFCFYGAGLLLNDLADLAEDRSARPQRPLPSGAVKSSAVWIVALGLMFGALGACNFGSPVALEIGSGLGVAIVAYNFGLKRIPLAGALGMGLCRGLSLLLGASFSGGLNSPALLAAAIVTFYIAAVTNLARHETASSIPAGIRWWPLAALWVGFLAFNFSFEFLFAAKLDPNDEPPFAAFLLHTNQLAFCAFFLPAIAAAARTAYKVGQPMQPVPPLIGTLIRALLFLQAAFCAAAGPLLIGIPAALFLLGCWPLSRRTSRRFYAS